MDYAVKQRLNLSERNCINLCERYRLLQEYGVCDSQVSRIDSLIWKSAGLILTMAIASLAYFGKSPTLKVNDLLNEIAVAIGVMAFTIVWYRLVLQWRGYMAVAFYRMQEIEIELGLWHYRYSFFLRENPNKRKLFLANLPEEIAGRFTKLESEIPEFRRIGISYVARVMTYLTIGGWIFILLRDIVGISISFFAKNTG